MIGRRHTPWAIASLAMMVVLTGCASSAQTDASTEGSTTGDTTEAEGGSDQETSDQGQEAEYVLRYATQQEQVGAPARTAAYWMDEVEERTDGRVQFERHYNGTLVTATETIPALEDGRIDVGWVSNSYSPPDYPLWTISGGELFLTTDAQALQEAWHRHYEENEAFREEFHELNQHFIMADLIANIAIATVEPVGSLADLQNRRIRAVGHASLALENAGMAPVSMALPETYEAMQRGVLDGISTFQFENGYSGSYYEVAPHVINPGIGTFAATGTAIRLDLWEELPKEIQDVMTEASKDAREYSVELMRELDKETCDYVLNEVDGDITLLADSDPEAVEAWASEAGPIVFDEWRQDAIEAGVNEEDLDNFIDRHREIVGELEGEGDFVEGIRACAER